MQSSSAVVPPVEPLKEIVQGDEGVSAIMPSTEMEISTKIKTEEKSAAETEFQSEMKIEKAIENDKIVGEEMEKEAQAVTIEEEKIVEMKVDIEAKVEETEEEKGMITVDPVTEEKGVLKIQAEAETKREEEEIVKIEGVEMQGQVMEEKEDVGQTTKTIPQLIKVILI